MSHPFYGQMWLWRWQLQQLLFRILCLPDHTGKHRSRVIRGEGGKGAQDPKVLIPVCRIHSTGKCGFGGGSCSSSFSEYCVYPIIQGSTEVGSKWY
ncbi:hypothetical protein CDAR_540121 [Caerostris darwini]|uniref:Secreted protein n=1 Tax=Caerostris darwini TaxID=1538125 RepID=A0AAV4WSN8_9ARAC|nr:hypothetical protein CDAR_540121 [Caerostris darwini]